MNKDEALKIIIECAKLYRDNLEGKNLLFISKDSKNKFNVLEVRFTKGNYQHLTGVVTNNKINPASFYNLCLNGKIAIKQFDFKKDGTTPLKLNVLPKLMNICKNANMIGDFNGNKPKLYAEKLAGNTFGCMGLVNDGNYYVPVTVLKEDMRDLAKDKERIIGIFTKEISDKLYVNLEYLAKGYKNIYEIPNNILERIDKDNLTCKFGTSFIQKPVEEIDNETLILNELQEAYEQAASVKEVEQDKTE